MPAPVLPLRDEVTIGERAPLTSGSAGLVILAHLPAGEAEAIVASRSANERRLGPADLARIRENGYLIGERHGNASMRGISAPLLDPATDASLGSLTLAALGERTTEATLLALVPVLLRECADLSPQLATLLGPSGARGRRGRDVTAQRREHTDRK